MTKDIGTKGELIHRLLQAELRPELVVTYRPDYLPVGCTKKMRRFMLAIKDK